MIVGSLGIGYLGLKAGAASVNIISQSIVDSSNILSKGNYKQGPTKDWAEGVSLAIGAFAPVFTEISNQGLLKSLFSNPAAKMKAAIKTISEGIVEAAIYFSKNKISFTGGPTKEWAEGVGKSIAAFAPVYKVLNDKGVWSAITGTGVTPDDMKSAIITISQGIVDAGGFFSKNSSAFGGTYPSEEWSDGIGKAITAFGPVFDWANQNKSWFGADTSFLKDSIITVAQSISDVSKILSKGNFSTNLNSNYIDVLAKNIKSYMSLINSLKFGDDTSTFLGFTIDRTSDISRMADDYEKLSKSVLSLSSSIESINLDKMAALKTLTGSIVLMSLMDSDQFNNMMDALEDKSKVFVDVLKELEEGTSNTEISIGTKGGSKSSGPSTKDILDVMYRIEGRLGQIAASSANLSSYVNEIRGKSSKSGLKK